MVTGARCGFTIRLICLVFGVFVATACSSPAPAEPELDTSAADVTPTGCKLPGDCPNPLDLCIAGICQPQTACKSDKQCTAMGMVCDADKGACVQCLVDSDCPGELTTCKGQTCQDPGIACTTSKMCPEGQLCSKSQGICVFCEGDGDCDDGQYCLDTICKPDQCTADQAVCLDAATRKVCVANGSGWTESKCAIDLSCIEGECTKTICTPGAKQCADGENGIVTCNANGTAWGTPELCPSDASCKDAACSPHVCAPNAELCNAEGALVSCAADGLTAMTWFCPVAPDGKPQICGMVDGTAVCKSPLCVAGASYCDSLKAMTCSADGLSASLKADCSVAGAGGKAQLCLDGGCVPAACKAGDKMCADAETLATCNAAGNGYDKTACGSKKACDNSACVAQVCVAGQATCFGQKAMKCNDSGTATAVVADCAATGKVCLNGGCASKVCTAGQATCQGGAVGVCKADGTGWDLTPCGANEACAGAKCVAKVCESGLVECLGKAIRACNGSGTAWVTVQDCATTNQTCLDGLCVASSCTAGTVSCDGKKVMQCNAAGTGWTTGEDCGASGKVCIDGKCAAAVCAPGALKCDGSKVSTCNAGATAWVVGEDCAGAGKVCVEGMCAVCVGGSVTCNGGKQATCKADGSGWAEASCDDGNSCTADSCEAGKGCVNVAAFEKTDCGGGKWCVGGVCSAKVVTPAGMVLIPAGTFWMGCNAAKDGKCNDNEKPQHKVTLSAYFIDLNETTVGEYKACVDATVCTAPSKVQPTQYATYPGLTNNPVNYVSWTQSVAYCKWRGPEYDLPTEAQWEMASRGSCEKNGSTAGDPVCAAAMRTYPWGEATATCSYAVMIGNGGYGCGTNAIWQVGQKPAGDSPYGLHDMAGNVWEWNRDWYAPYPAEAQSNPTGPGSAYHRVDRGGTFGDDAGALRSGFRNSDSPAGASSFTIGLRCVRSSP